MKRPRSSNTRASNESRSGLTGVRILAISLGLFLAALLLCFFGKLGLDRAELSKSWPSAPAGSHVEKREYYDEELGRTRYRYTSTIHYTVNGKGFGMKVGGRVTGVGKVFYNPDNPEESVLEPGVASAPTNLAFCGAAFLGFLGVAVLVISMSPESD